MFSRLVLVVVLVGVIAPISSALAQTAPAQPMPQQMQISQEEIYRTRMMRPDYHPCMWGDPACFNGAAMGGFGMPLGGMMGMPMNFPMGGMMGMMFPAMRAGAMRTPR